MGPPKKSKRQRKQKEKHSLKYKRNAIPASLADGLQEALAGLPAPDATAPAFDSNAAILPAKPAEGEEADEQGEQPDQPEKQLSKSQQRKLRKIQEEKERRAQRVQVCACGGGGAPLGADRGRWCASEPVNSMQVGGWGTAPLARCMPAWGGAQHPAPPSVAATQAYNPGVPNLLRSPHLHPSKVLSSYTLYLPCPALISAAPPLFFPLRHCRRCTGPASPVAAPAQDGGAAAAAPGGAARAARDEEAGSEARSAAGARWDPGPRGYSPAAGAPCAPRRRRQQLWQRQRGRGA